MAETVAVILAAGQGKRMYSRLPKVLHRVAGRSLLEHVLAATRQAGIEDNIIVIGHGAEEVRAALGPEQKYALQEQQLGTGHALAQAREAAGEATTVLVLCGDTPLIRPATLSGLLQHHQATGAAVTILSARVADPTGYGRIIRDGQGQVKGIVEERDATPAEKAINEINTGIYCFAAAFLWPALGRLKPDNDQGEYYLTDVVAMAVSQELLVQTLVARDTEEVLGVNDRAQLAAAGAVWRRRVNTALMLDGVTIIDPEATYIDVTVTIGKDTIIYPGTFLEGHTIIGAGCCLGPGTTIRDSRVGDGSTVIHAVVLGSTIGPDCQVGPFAYLRPGTVLEAGVKVGDFVEIKASRIGRGSKVPHLTYLGDATVGTGVNIGAGTITCNYDGRQKWPTIIEDGAFIGSNTNLVAPVRVGAGALVGAGSTITKDVPAGALALARERQVNLPTRGKKDDEKRQEK
ncbi:Bifunctional UDP-N-acetylglucosamine pyrophosphorylase/glucosamine-1-phosphate N-acetyltransferase [Moorella glycerini]|uniref:Bifunctional protein GlmU n=1 Tax=Neomoorella stamsii TaxID=1266720 RepID=A0A9X7IZX5_9FIRM|nr:MULTISPECIES: bifunctional UDP-N-acetylglucosamine diphosphorylase/glucosamine-1-phosphate N-acetyltransferase GlmU [Moorella]PRR68751.1 Bifunctional protein GlmU [Moorella stamsii]CEP68397.1 Bifunctional UDP-N-acetylglucosamine pyrophosphorylase/glucosamine-1-phosphate N-acetyltransferase [Moorella glycerini]